VKGAFDMDVCKWSTAYHDRLRGGKSGEYLNCFLLSEPMQ
jgi:hypothetical protein